jgi:hypothetical protein
MGWRRWWLDGALQGVYTNLEMPGHCGFVEYHRADVGRVQGTKAETDHYRLDQCPH